MEFIIFLLMLDFSYKMKTEHELKFLFYKAYSSSEKVRIITYSFMYTACNFRQSIRQPGLFFQSSFKAGLSLITLHSRYFHPECL